MSLSYAQQVRAEHDKAFISYEISPIVLPMDPTKDIIFCSSPEEAQEIAEKESGLIAWGLYGELPNGTVEHISDRESWEEICLLYQRIVGESVNSPVEREPRRLKGLGWTIIHFKRTWWLSNYK